jgi:hypothetical protein
LLILCHSVTSNISLRRFLTVFLRRPGRKADNLYHLHVPIVLKSGSLNLLEPSGPVKACNGIAVPLTLWHTQPAVRRSEPPMSLLLVLAFCR